MPRLKWRRRDAAGLARVGDLCGGKTTGGEEDSVRATKLSGGPANGGGGGVMSCCSGSWAEKDDPHGVTVRQPAVAERVGGEGVPGGAKS